jgi:hypothetical protein
MTTCVRTIHTLVLVACGSTVEFNWTSNNRWKSDSDCIDLVEIIRIKLVDDITFAHVVHHTEIESEVFSEVIVWERRDTELYVGPLVNTISTISLNSELMIIMSI